MKGNVAGIVRSKWTHLEKKYYLEALHFYDEVVFINPERVTYRLERQNNGIVVEYEGMILNDLAMGYTLGRVNDTLLLAKSLEMCGCPTSDPYNTISRDCLDKLNDSLLLLSAGVGTTAHVLISLSLAREYLDKLDSKYFPLLNKPITGNRGKGIVALYTRSEAIEFCEAHFRVDDVPLVFEQLMKYVHEYRVYIVDGKAVEAYEKVRSDDAIVMNLHQGASPQEIEETAKSRIFQFLEEKLPDRYRLGVYGADLAETVDGIYHVIEINRTPGFGGLRRLGLLNFPRYVHSVISRRSRRVDIADERGKSYTLTLLGDTNPGETYQLRLEELGGENILKTRGYAYGFTQFRDFLAESDFTVANLEACVTSHRNSPFIEDKPYLDWTDVNETPTLLKQLSIDAVSLANNHSLDFGAEGMAEALDILKRNDINTFGAGMSEVEAEQAVHRFVQIGEARLHLIIAAGYEFQRPHIRRGYYATPRSAGTKLWNNANAMQQLAALRQRFPEAFIIAYPHWGSNYLYVVERQEELAKTLIDAGADLIVGHGSHMMQEIGSHNGRWIVYGIGNFVYNSPGRYARHDVLPYGLLTRLIFFIDKGRICINVRLYPTHIDNSKTGYQSHFVTENQFLQAVNFFMPHKGESTGLERKLRSGKDRHGFYLTFDIYRRQNSTSDGSSMIDVTAS